MSGTDYTQTPNHGLYKPISNADINGWGGHLNANADTLDALLGPGGASGPWLPLAGGLVSGHLNVASSPTVSGSTFPQPFYTSITGSGTTTATGQPQWNMLLTTDSVIANSVNSITNLANYYNVTNSTGARMAETISFSAGPTNDIPGNYNYFQALNVNIGVNGTLGGTAGNYGGQAFGSNICAVLMPAAQYINEVSGLEVDVACRAGSSVAYKHCISAVLQGGDAVESSAAPSAAYGIGLSADSPASPGFGYGLAIGGPQGWWPMNPVTGIIIYVDPRHFTGSAAYTCATGIDFSAVAFSSAFLKSTGFTVDGSGHTSPLLTNAANDAAAATAGVPVGAMYRNGNAVQVRLT